MEHNAAVPAVHSFATRLSQSPDLDSGLAYKRREAKWKQLVSSSHKEWCECGNYLNHFPCGGDGGAGDGGDGGADAIIPDIEDIYTEEDFIDGDDRLETLMLLKTFQEDTDW